MVKFYDSIPDDLAEWVSYTLVPSSPSNQTKQNTIELITN